jgi:DNA-binding CsgD family transcriptional regulator
LELIEAVLAGNKRYKEIATALNIAVNTVKTHLKNIYRITGVSNIQALILLFSNYNPQSPQSHPKIT